MLPETLSAEPDTEIVWWHGFLQDQRFIFPKILAFPTRNVSSCAIMTCLLSNWKPSCSFKDLDCSENPNENQCLNCPQLMRSQQYRQSLRTCLSSPPLHLQQTQNFNYCQLCNIPDWRFIKYFVTFPKSDERIQPDYVSLCTNADSPAKHIDIFNVLIPRSKCFTYGQILNNCHLAQNDSAYF